MKSSCFLIWVVLLSGSALNAFAEGTSVGTAGGANEAPINPALVLGDGEKLITLLATNDIHGGVEAGKSKDGQPQGGMAFWAGIVTSIKQGLANRYTAARAGVLVLDAGDQFQGTLISNYNEGQLLFAAMNEVGYDAVIPGNHDYDFGPVGWLEDQVTPTSVDQNPRGALLKLVSQAAFPLVSANTYLRASLKAEDGKLVETDSSGCRVTGDARIDWSRAARPTFLKPYVIREAAGVRVAIIGLDNPETPLSTTLANVSDLCFDDEVGAYQRVRQELAGQADVFVVVMHDGNTSNSFGASDFVRKLPVGSVDAVVSGHTHFVSNARVNGVAIIQSGSGGEKFGRIDLIYDTRTHAVLPARTRSFGGIEMMHSRCAPSAQSFCASGTDIAYEGVSVVPSQKILKLVASARAQVASVAGRKLGTADGLVKVDRIHESPLANALTDSLRSIAGSDIAFLNTGGIRTTVGPGDVTYEDLFKVLPFNNHGLLVGPMGADKVLALLDRSIQSCGIYGSLMQSGLKVSFERIDCTKSTNQLDPNARLLHVETLAGEVIYDVAQGMVAPSVRSFNVATLDFLAAGGSGFDGFKGSTQIRDFGIVREAMTEYYLANPAHFSVKVDGRWSEQVPSSLD
jgi:5'-nucleotidase